MLRIQGVNIPDKKRGEIALTYIFGIGKSSSNEILKKANIDKDKKVIEWSNEEVIKVREVIESGAYKVEGNLRSEIRINIKRLKDINCYRGKRHRLHLPVNGQRTQTNARTRKGKKKTVANKKKVTK